jgi:hypothetical protein
LGLGLSYNLNKKKNFNKQKKPVRRTRKWVKKNPR